MYEYLSYLSAGDRRKAIRLARTRTQWLDACYLWQNWSRTTLPWLVPSKGGPCPLKRGILEPKWLPLVNSIHDTRIWYICIWYICIWYMHMIHTHDTYDTCICYMRMTTVWRSYNDRMIVWRGGQHSVSASVSEPLCAMHGDRMAIVWRGIITGGTV